MSGLKLPLLLLLLVVAIFVVFMITGSSKNDVSTISKSSQSSSKGGTKSDPDPTKTEAQGFNPDDYPVISSLGSVLGAFSPKLNVKQILPSLLTYNLQAQPAYTLTVSKDSSNKFRSAKFRVPASTTRRCAHLEYKSAETPPTGLSDLQDQDSENLGSADKANPKTEIALTVLSSGGTITIQRNAGFVGTCTVVLEQ